jgi:ABC-type sugar transport system ATPase subunit
MTGRFLLSARGIVVRYGATTALDGVDIDLHAGEVHAVVGENGAGKSTLLRAIAGVVRPMAGTVRVRQAAQLAWVPQETLLPPDLTAVEWIFLGQELRGRFRWLREGAMQEVATRVLREIGCGAPPHARVGALAVAQRKQVQLARALRSEPDLLLLDEPTAVLGGAETRALFSILHRLRERGAGILYVSHRLDEVLAIADRITVLRDGRHVSTDVAHAVDTAALVERMVGRDVQARQRSHQPLQELALELVDVATAHVRGLSLSVCRGEVVGLAGLVGAGRSEVLEAIAGLRRLRTGRCVAHAAPVLVPEDRGDKGLVPTLGLRDNLFLPAQGWLLRRGREEAMAREWIARLRIRTSGTEAPIDSLSGGNQQKLLLARALRHEPQLLLLDEPTAGVDIGAKAEIHDIIRQLAANGAAILLASSDLPEILLLCDKIVALRAGEVAGVVTAEQANEARLAALITGAEQASTPCSR